MYDRVRFKWEARQAMGAAVPHFMLVALVYYLLTSGLSLASDFLSMGSESRPTAYLLSWFLSCLLSLFGVVMAFGFCSYCLRLVRREPARVGSLFHGFSMAGRVIGLRLLVTLFMVLWGMLFGVGLGICLAVLLAAIDSTALLVVLAVILYLALVLGLYAFFLRYAMVEFALLDYPNDGIMTAIRRSKGMMKGWTGKLFRLMLPFLGLLLLVYVIFYGITAAGLYFGEREWLVKFFRVINELENSPYSTTIASLSNALLQKMLPYELIAMVLTLPLQMWRAVYATCAQARFYNYVGGYDYLQYMQAQQRPPQRPQPQPAPYSAPPVHSETYYTPLNIPEGNHEEPPETPPPVAEILPVIPEPPGEEAQAPVEEAPVGEPPEEEASAAEAPTEEGADEAEADGDETEEL